MPGSENPDNPYATRYRSPDFSVENASCAFADATKSSAECAFDLLGSGERRRVETGLTRRFRDLSNEVVHNWLAVRWEVDGVCAPAR